MLKKAIQVAGLLFLIIESSSIFCVDNPQLLQKVYAAYNEQTNAFDYVLPSGAQQCLDVVVQREQEIGQELNSLSYKDVFFSRSGLAQMAGLVAGVLGSFYAHKNELMGIENKWDFNEWDPVRKKGDWRWYFSEEYFKERQEAYDKSVYSQAGFFSGDLYKNSTRGFVSASALIAAVSGFGLARNIKAMRDKKNALSQERAKCGKIMDILFEL
jgi:hypothetical protein